MSLDLLRMSLYPSRIPQYLPVCVGHLSSASPCLCSRYLLDLRMSPLIRPFLGQKNLRSKMSSQTSLYLFFIFHAASPLDHSVSSSDVRVFPLDLSFRTSLYLFWISCIPLRLPGITWISLYFFLISQCLFWISLYLLWYLRVRISSQISLDPTKPPRIPLCLPQISIVSFSDSPISPSSSLHSRIPPRHFPYFPGCSLNLPISQWIFYGCPCIRHEFPSISLYLFFICHHASPYVSPGSLRIFLGSPCISSGSLIPHLPVFFLDILYPSQTPRYYMDLPVSLLNLPSHIPLFPLDLPFPICQCLFWISLYLLWLLLM
jgi:hypothetical protein